MTNGYTMLDDILTPNECREIIDKAEAIGFMEADISYASGSKMNKDYRNNSRVQLTDEEVRLTLERALLPHVPAMMPSQRKLVGISPKFRVYKYEPGQEFKKHRDGNQADDMGIALITILVYLNEAGSGGETVISDRSLPQPVSILPRAGRALLFDHKLMHSGEPLREGLKYVLRTDVIYSI